MKTGTRDHLCDQSGFSLVEIMVGLLIGMLGIIVMMQVYSTAEERKRTTTAGSDAQNTAIIALDMLQRDITRSGLGFANRELLNNCTIQLPNGGPIPLAPVIINPAAGVIPAGDANTDTLLIAYGIADDQPDGYIVTNQSGTVYTIQGTGSMKQGDRVVASAAPCAGTLRLGTIQSVNLSTITLNTSSAGTALYNLGANPRFLAYAVRNGNLTVCDYMANDCSVAGSVANANIWRPIANNVASLRAQYVHSGNVFDQTAPAGCNGWFNTTQAIRFALVTRSTQFEKEAVTGAAPGWSGSATTPVDLTTNTLADPSEWTHYRYRVFETAAPIRNVSWMSGCT